MVADSDNEIHFEKVEDGLYGIVATACDVQVGWCRQLESYWILTDMDEK